MGFPLIGKQFLPHRITRKNPLHIFKGFLRFSSVYRLPGLQSSPPTCAGHEPSSRYESRFLLHCNPNSHQSAASQRIPQASLLRPALYGWAYIDIAQCSFPENKTPTFLAFASTHDHLLSEHNNSFRLHSQCHTGGVHFGKPLTKEQTTLNYG